MSEELRKHERYPLRGIQGSMLFASEVNVINLSLGGAAIEADKRLNIGKEYALKLETRSGVLSLKGVVVWSVISRSRRTESGSVVPVYLAGLKFTDIFSEKAKDLLDFLERRKAEDESRLSGMRFTIDTTQPAQLRFPANYTVRKLSTDGMDIEIDREFYPEDLFKLEVSLDGDIPISVSSKVVSCRTVPREGESLFEVRIRFVDMTANTRAAIARYVKSLR